MQYDENGVILLAQHCCDILLKTRCLLLSGPVGAGKTVLAKAIIQRLCPGVDNVVSPSFPIMLLYESIYGPLWHIDLYRLDEETCAQECEAMGLFEALETDLALIEWPQRLHPMPTGTWVHIDFTADPQQRDVCFTENCEQ